MPYNKEINGIIKNIREAVNKDWSQTSSSFNDTLSIKRLAEDARMSTTNFKRFFKANIDTHETVHQFISRLRMQHILKLIKEGKNFDDIASMVGFANTPALNNTLRKIKNATPSELKDLLQIKDVKAYPYKIAPSRIEKSVDFNIITKNFESGYNQSDSSWDEIYNFAKATNILLPGQQEYWGLTFDDADVEDSNNNHFCTAMTVTDTSPIEDSEYGHMNIDGDYAVFTHKGDYNLLDSFYDAILAQIPVSEFYGSKPILEKYLIWDVQEPKDLVTEVFVPLYRQ